MSELHGIADKFEREVDILLDQLEPLCGPGEPEDAIITIARVELALAQAKRVRSHSTLVVRSLAALRDQLQP